MEQVGVLEAIYRYPVKSMAGDIDAIFTRRFILSWERGRHQNVLHSGTAYIVSLWMAQIVKTTYSETAHYAGQNQLT